mmetsp:Transcript_7316/g.11133  ORF Transcript_7316/g.11133 Transcript_7316/m.11133 type:complete len:85 (-) Transcript_7316:133-387(-)
MPNNPPALPSSVIPAPDAIAAVLKVACIGAKAWIQVLSSVIQKNAPMKAIRIAGAEVSGAEVSGVIVILAVYYYNTVRLIGYVL